MLTLNGFGDAESDEVLVELLAAGANVEAKCGSDNITPLGLATVYENPRCVRLFLRAGASIPVDLDSLRGITPSNRLYAYLTRIRAVGFAAYESAQRRLLESVVTKATERGRIPAELVSIIAAFWGHPGDY